MNIQQNKTSSSSHKPQDFPLAIVGKPSFVNLFRIFTSAFFQRNRVGYWTWKWTSMQSIHHCMFKVCVSNSGAVWKQINTWDVENEKKAWGDHKLMPSVILVPSLRVGNCNTNYTTRNLYFLFTFSSCSVPRTQIEVTATEVFRKISVG